MTVRDVAARIGPPTESVEFRNFVRDSSLWAITSLNPVPVRIESSSMADARTRWDIAPGDTTYSRTDTWEKWDDRPSRPYMQTWEVFYQLENGEWHVSRTDDRSSGIVFW